METYKIYLSGGMSALSQDEQSVWRDLITEMFYRKCKTLDIKYRLEIFSPPAYFNFTNPTHLSELEVMKFDLRHTKSSNLIIVNFNDPNSIGTSQEMAVAYDHDITILGLNLNNGNLHPWLVCDCDRIFDDIEKCVDYVIKFYLQ